MEVYLLYALYPCEGWLRSDYHQHPGNDCECEDFLEGVFSSADAAKAYIPAYLNEKHANLKWEIQDLRAKCGYYDEHARTDADLVYWIREHEVISAVD